MGTTMAMDPARDWLLVTMTGPITYDAIVAHIQEERGRRDLSYREFIDATEATADFSPSQARAIVSMLRELGKSEALGPTAVLVGSDYTFGMLRMLEILLEGVQSLRPFRSRREAEAWLADAPATLL
jgi:hypothetical protein